MFDVGFWEVSLIAVVALVVVGPERLPALARTLGLYVGKARRYADHVRREIERDVDAAQLREIVDKKNALEDVGSVLEETKSVLEDTEKEFASIEAEMDAGTEQDREPFVAAGKAIDTPASNTESSDASSSPPAVESIGTDDRQIPRN